jgi:hypothetical protein
MSSSSQNPAITTMNLSGIHGFISIQRFAQSSLIKWQEWAIAHHSLTWQILRRP